MQRSSNGSILELTPFLQLRGIRFELFASQRVHLCEFSNGKIACNNTGYDHIIEAWLRCKDLEGEKSEQKREERQLEAED